MFALCIVCSMPIRRISDPELYAEVSFAAYLSPLLLVTVCAFHVCTAFSELGVHIILLQVSALHM